MRGLKKISVTDAARGFSEVVNQVYYKGARFLLTKGSRLVASLEPVGATGAVRAGDLPKILASLPPLPDEDRREFLKEAREARNLRPPVDRWES